MKLMSLGIIGLLGALLTLSACAPNRFFGSLSSETASQTDCGFVQNVYGERISWKGKIPIQIQIHESVPKEFYPALEEAFQSWETATGKKLFEVTQWGAQGPILPRQDGVNMVYWMSAWESDKSKEQARTSVYWVGDQIREADIRINAQDFTFYVDKAKTARDVHFGSLMAHEAGHVLGLKHKDFGNSVMGTYLASDTVRNQLATTDVESIRCEY